MQITISCVTNNCSKNVGLILMLLHEIYMRGHSTKIVEIPPPEKVLTILKNRLLFYQIRYNN
jgi:hypothetical protein